ncbi:MAG: ComF family protein [Ruminococcaceae bacterium]|nr:ComF family protein [Oscillospiraceae bacterium]
MDIIKLLNNIIFGNICPVCRQPMEITDSSLAHAKCIELLNQKLKNGVISINDINITADKFLFSYSNSTALEMVLEMKSHTIRKACKLFATIAAKCISEDVTFPDFDVVTHCPRKPAKKRINGYDHSQLFAKYLAQMLGKPYLELVKRRETGGEQKKMKSVSARKKNVKNKFFHNTKYPVKKTRVLIVDDVITTGSTAIECASVLKRAGARQVSALFILD